MKDRILLPAFLLLSVLLFGQSQNTYTEEDLRELANIGPSSPGIRTIDLTYEGVRGTPFLSEEWQKGAFQLKDQQEFSQDLQIMIDLKRQYMYFRLNNGFTGNLPASKLEAVRLNAGEEQYRIFSVYPEAEVEGSNTKQLKFYEELYSGPFTLLKHHFKLFREANYKSAYTTGRPYDEYVPKSNLYLREQGHAFHKVKMKKKAIQKVLPNYADKIQQVIKRQKLSLLEEEDLIQLLRHLQE